MKRSVYFAAVWFAVIFLAASSAWSQLQEVDGYMVIRGSTSSAVCLGRWVPSSETGKPGVCEGPIVDVSQLTAISSKLSADRLDQVLLFLASLDEKLSVSNDQFERLIEAMVTTQELLDRQTEQNEELLRDAISSRFEALSRRVMASDAFRKELEKLKEDIIEELKKYSSGRQEK